MNVTVTSIKAPWPEGARVGSVVSIPYDAIPPHLVGKCMPADAEAEAAHVYEPPEPITLPAAAPSAPAADPDELKAAQSLLVEARAEADELRARLAAAESALSTVTTERDELKAAAEAAQQETSSKSGKGAK